MATTPTQNSVPSESPRDLKFNAGKIDEFVTSLALKFKDRFGGDHYTIEGLRQLAQQAIAAYGWVPMDSFQDGATLTLPNQVLRWKLPDGDGDYYRWDGTFPKTVDTASTPESTGGIGAGAWLSVGDAVFRGQYERTEWNNFIYSFGGTPDYTGTPLYDGNDQSRITATDNTPALLNALTNGEIRNGVLNVYFPAGHYGFKTIIPQQSATPSVKEVIFHGDGIESTILDFIFEDKSHTAGVDETTANALLRLTGFDKVTFSNMTTKCTTKAGPVDGNMSPDNANPSAYFGAVWFSHIQDCKEVNYYSVLSERANYRGHSISGEGMPLGSRTYVNLYNCHGRYTTSSPWWLRHCNKLSVYGGEFYRNGFKGITATGYGITANQYVDDVYLSGASFYENYRKGFDRHSGIGSLIAVNCSFIDNVLFDLYDNKQYFGLYPTDKFNYVSVYGCSFILNRNKKFLKEAIDAIYTGDFVYKNVIAIYDESINATPANKNSRVHVSNCSFRCMGPMLTPYKNFLGIKGDSSELRVENCTIDWSELSLLATDSNAYTSQPFSNSEPSNRVVMINSSVLLPDGKLIKPNGTPSNTSMFTMFGSGLLVLEGNQFDLKNYTIVAGTASGNSSSTAIVKKFNNNTFKFRDIQLETFGVTVSTGMLWFESPVMFGNASSSVQSGGNKIGLGDCSQMFDFTLGTNFNPPTRFTIRADNKPVGATVKILLGQIGGNVAFDLVGKIGLSNDKYSGYYRGSLNTHVVVTGSAFVGLSSTLVDEQIKLNGVNTNFVAKAAVFTWGAASNDGNGQYYVAEVSTRQSYTPVVIGIY